MATAAPPRQPRLERPHGCGIDPQGNLYIADGMNYRVRVVGMDEEASVASAGGKYPVHDR